MMKLDKLLANIFYFDQNSKQDINSTKVDFDEIIKSVLIKLSPQKINQNLNWDVKVEQDLDFYSDADRIQNMLMHIIHNAIIFQDKDNLSPKIWIQVNKAKNGCTLSIKDNGVGIDEIYLDNIFDMFYRASEMSTGSGLGLYLVKETINKLV